MKKIYAHIQAKIIIINFGRKKNKIQMILTVYLVPKKNKKKSMKSKTKKLLFKNKNKKI